VRPFSLQCSSVDADPQNSIAAKEYTRFEKVSNPIREKYFIGKLLRATQKPLRFHANWQVIKAHNGKYNVARGCLSVKVGDRIIPYPDLLNGCRSDNGILDGEIRVNKGSGDSKHKPFWGVWLSPRPSP